MISTLELNLILVDGLFQFHLVSGTKLSKSEFFVCHLEWIGYLCRSNPNYEDMNKFVNKAHEIEMMSFHCRCSMKDIALPIRIASRNGCTDIHLLAFHFVFIRCV